MKRVEVLIVNDMKGNTRIDERKINEILDQFDESVDKIIINKITLPVEDDNLLGVHIIVREVAET